MTAKGSGTARDTENEQLSTEKMRFSLTLTAQDGRTVSAKTFCNFLPRINIKRVNWSKSSKVTSEEGKHLVAASVAGYRYQRPTDRNISSADSYGRSLVHTNSDLLATPIYFFLRKSLSSFSPENC